MPRRAIIGPPRDPAVSPERALVLEQERRVRENARRPVPGIPGLVARTVAASRRDTAKPAPPPPDPRELRSMLDGWLDEVGGAVRESNPEATLEEVTRQVLRAAAAAPEILTTAEALDAIDPPMVPRPLAAMLRARRENGKASLPTPPAVAVEGDPSAAVVGLLLGLWSRVVVLEAHAGHTPGSQLASRATQERRLEARWEQDAIGPLAADLLHRFGADALPHGALGFVRRRATEGAPAARKRERKRERDEPDDRSRSAA